ncbi:MAG: ferrous iron transport protein B [Cytophagales bacterium]|nr:ferrous iron transport protein B [Cytophagales bacterium]
MERIRNVALLGNPNSGKSSLFNQLTGLNQKVGNFPGVTVEKKTGICSLNNGEKLKIVDLPGSYSLYPRSLDEYVVFNTLLDKNNPEHPDLAIVIIDASNIKRNLLLFTQVTDLGIPTILVLNMLDVATNRGQRVSPTQIGKSFSTSTISLNARTGQGVELLKKAISKNIISRPTPIFNSSDFENGIEEEIKKNFSIEKDFIARILLIQYENFPGISDEERKLIKDLIRKKKFNPELSQSKEILKRYEIIDKVIHEAVVYNLQKNRNLTEKLDKIFTHRIFGYVIFLGILFLMFQAVFAWAQAPMEFIDYSFSEISVFLKSILSAGVLTNLITEGVIPGIGGVIIFIPQIAILFAFISVLEETGYMSRVVFLTDKIMRRFGLNGKSIVPLISGVACAIPAILATRTIGNWKERLITIFVTPLMSCSARLPVYTILIALVVPEDYLLGFLNIQALALMGLYILGFVMSIISASIVNLVVKAKEKGYFIMELPLYKLPRWKNVGITIYEKSSTFALEAGKIILAISIILWVAASYGPGDKVENAESYVSASLKDGNIDEKDFEAKVDAFKLENSFAGIFGKALEPAIKPLGYDWKIGIALVTSFAAREVFVGTMATIYSIGSEEESTIKSRMAAEINPDTGQAMYTPAVAFSLLVFYAFAMQCMSTLAVVKKETNSWKWPILQLFYMTGLAYLCSLIVYNIFS